jgi:hypothetical protein
MSVIENALKTRGYSNLPFPLSTMGELLSVLEEVSIIRIVKLSMNIQIMAHWW